ncbi:hypothetical protein D3C76_1617180 [compost metagenome]
MFSSPRRCWCRPLTSVRKVSSDASNCMDDWYTSRPSSVRAKPARPRWHRRRPRRCSRSLICWLMAERPMPSTLSAAEKPPHSTTLRKMRSRRISKSLTWARGSGRRLLMV